MSAAPAVAVSGDPAVERFREEHRAGEVQERREPPEAAEADGQVADGERSSVMSAMAVDDDHLPHELVVGEVRHVIRDAAIVQRKIGQLVLAVPPRELLDLGRAESAPAVVYYSVGSGALDG